MVDLGKFGGDDDDSKSSSSKSKKKKKKKKKSSGGGGTEPYKMSEEEKMKVKGEESPDIYEDSKRLADVGGSDDYKKGTSSLSKFKEIQTKEMREFYNSFLSDVKSAADNLADGETDIEAFTVAFQAATYNLAQYKAGVAQVLIDEFGKQKPEAVSIANTIAHNAGEEKMVNEVSKYLTRKLMDM